MQFFWFVLCLKTQTVIFVLKSKYVTYYTRVSDKKVSRIIWMASLLPKTSKKKVVKKLCEDSKKVFTRPSGLTISLL
jgi:hypothetical protein